MQVEDGEGGGGKRSAESVERHKCAMVGVQCVLGGREADRRYSTALGSILPSNVENVGRRRHYCGG